MPQQGAVFGTIRYGEATYGRPLDLTGAALPSFSIMPATATPLSYQSIQLIWSLPRSGTNLRLVRNGNSVPANETDGTILIEQAINARPVFIDNTLSPDGGGQFYYYTLWNEDTAGNWWRAGDIEAVLPKDWGYASLLASLLPRKLLDDDDQLATATLTKPHAAHTWNSVGNLTWDEVSASTWEGISNSWDLLT